MLAMEVTCRRCRSAFEPTVGDYRTGTWHTCPACRDEPAGKAAEVLEADTRRVPGHTTRRN